MWGPDCPQCKQGPTEWLSTDNEYRWYCKPCDIRFNDRLEIYQPEKSTESNQLGKQ
jgi:transposase-like protein